VVIWASSYVRFAYNLPSFGHRWKGWGCAYQQFSGTSVLAFTQVYSKILKDDNCFILYTVTAKQYII
jgi:hypothetical protein